MTIEELEKKVIELEEKYADLEIKYLRLREWSDDNDFWLREMIDALTESVDALIDNHCCCEVYRERHKNYIAEKKMEKEREALELELASHHE